MGGGGVLGGLWFWLALEGGGGGAWFCWWMCGCGEDVFCDTCSTLSPAARPARLPPSFFSHDEPQGKQRPGMGTE